MYSGLLLLSKDFWVTGLLNHCVITRLQLIWRATEWMPFQSHSSFTILFVVHTLQIARDCSAWLYFLPPRLWVSHITESLRQGIMASQTSDLYTPILYRGRRQRQQIPTESNWNMRGRIRVTQRVCLLPLAYGCLVL